MTDVAIDQEAFPEDVGEGKLVAAVEGRSTELTAIAALKELNRRQTRRRTAVMESVLADPTASADMKVTAVTALGRDHRVRNREALVAALGSKEPVVVRRAADALGRIGDESALARLNKLRPRQEPVRRSVSLARALISGRLGLASTTLEAPGEDRVVKPGSKGRIDIEFGRMPLPAAKKAIASVADQLGAIRLRPEGALEARCGGEELAFAVNRDLDQRKTLNALTKRCALIGVVLQRSEGLEAHVVREYVITEPAGAAELNLFGFTVTGAMAHAGTVVVDGKQAALTVRSLDTPRTRPVHVEATYDHETKRWTVGRAEVSDFRGAAPKMEIPIRDE